MFRLKSKVLNILISLVILGFLITETEGFCMAPFCNQISFLGPICCNFNSDCCSSASLGDNPNCIKVSVANN
ncbi:hypothetical protein HNY73_002442 [Argiope bruennichi]|uniref:Uncharacterized protein n=1 Tax=Argiope bruennichi TaxID=94029 RepID=A0A8T0FZZ2_ARGBR|nr:hypothetical protein HNY73_002442 [Argiope bruennichi]